MTSDVAQLTFGTTWRMVIRGLALGGVLGAAYGLVVAGIYGLIFGFVIGAVGGAVLGIVCGLVVSVLSLVVFRPPRSMEKYQMAMAATAAGTTIVVIALYAFWPLKYDLQNLVMNQQIAITVVAPSVIAALASGYAGWQVARWTGPQLMPREGSREYGGR